MKRVKQVTIKEVASLAGCSVSSVSLVMNQKGVALSKALRERVLEAAAALDYRPNQLAISLVKQRSKTLGLIVPDISNHFFAKLAKIIGDEGQARGFNIILSNSDDDALLEDKHIDLLLDKAVDGLLLCLSSGTNREEAEAQIEKLERRRVPYCLIDRYYQGVGRYVVSVDHYGAARLATQALIDAGHRRIACLSGPPLLETTRDRLRAYQDCLQAAGLEADEQLIFPGDFGWQSALAQVDALLASRSTALFAFNDLSAMGILRGLYERGLELPRDLSLVSVDDSDYALLSSVPLSSVRQPLEAIGKRALEIVLQEIRGESPAEGVTLFDVQLIKRASIAAPSC